MKAEDFKGKTPDELKALILDLKKQQFNLRFQRSQGQLENTATINTVRRDIARAKTFLAQDAVKGKTAAKKDKAQTSAKPKKAVAKVKKSAA